MSDVCEEIAKAQDGFYKESTVVASNGRTWIAVPWCVLGALVAYRKSWFDEVGQAKFPETWEEYREVGKKLKAKGRPIGQTLGHTFGDAPAFGYAYLWSWGGKEVEADGKTVVLNTKPTVDSVKLMTAFCKEAHNEGGLGLGRYQQQPGISLRHHQRDVERGIDLSAGHEQARDLPDRKGHAPVAGYLACAAAPRVRRANSATTCRCPTC